MRRLIACAVAATLSGCAVGPDYVRPDVDLPAAYKEGGDWKPAEPSDTATRAPWWRSFGDAELDALQAQVEERSQSWRYAESQLRQARAAAAGAHAAFWPTLSAQASATRGRTSADVSKTGATAVADDRRFALGAAWEADLWGRIERGAEAADATAEAAAADLESARLALHVELAKNYFLLRTADAQRRLLARAETAYVRSLELTRNRFRLGVASQLDVLQAETQLHGVRVQIKDAGIARAQAEHAIAILVGRPASGFAIAEAGDPPLPPALPVGLPSQLLERRPDVAAAERRAAAANAQIGAARAAWFPTFVFNGSIGSESASLAHWFTAPARFWSFGPTLAATLFDGGARGARVDQAEAAAEGSVAFYRQTVLKSVQEVEDNLAAQRILSEEAQLQDAALDAARRTLTLTEHQYRGGVVSYLNVVTAQTTALAAERTALDIRSRRLGASIALIAALGGGW